MLTKFAATAAIVCLSGTAFADGFFNVKGSIDASDNPAVQGAPITTDGTYYQAALGTDNPPSEGFLDLIGQALEEDSYIALDGANANGEGRPSDGGPTNQLGDGYTANPATTALPTEFSASSLNINAAFSMPGTGITSKARPALATGQIIPDSLEVVFFARLTVIGGSGGVDAPSVVVNIEDGDGTLVALDLTIGVANAVDFNGRKFFILNNQHDGEFGTINDLYVAAALIPTPGAAGLLGLAGLAAARRRRR